MITLINGCSNTAGKDLNPGECWSDLYKEWSTDDVLNIAKSGQSNHSICRETIRCLELNSEIQSIVVMFTAFYRTEIFKEKSIEYITYHSLQNAQRPIPKQSIWWNDHTQKVFKEWFEVQDMRNFQEKDCYDMFCLQQYCKHNNIKYKFLWAYEFPLVNIFLLNGKQLDISTEPEKYYYSNYIGKTLCRDESINLMKFWVHNYANGDYKSEAHRCNGHYSADVHKAFFKSILSQFYE